jgi:hypothetical protein
MCPKGPPAPSFHYPTLFIIELWANAYTLACFDLHGGKWVRRFTQIVTGFTYVPIGQHPAYTTSACIFILA